MRRLLPLLGLACTYSFGGFLPGRLKSAFVEELENTTPRQGLQTLVREELLRAIREDGRLRLVGKSEAGLLIRGEVGGYDKRPEEYDQSGKILSYRVTLRVKLTFWDAAGDSAYIGPKLYSGFGIYKPDAGSEDDAAREAVRMIARQALGDLFTAGF